MDVVEMVFLVLRSSSVAIASAARLCPPRIVFAQREQMQSIRTSESLCQEDMSAGIGAANYHQNIAAISSSMVRVMKLKRYSCIRSRLLMG